MAAQPVLQELSQNTNNKQQDDVQQGLAQLVSSSSSAQQDNSRAAEELKIYELNETDVEDIGRGLTTTFHQMTTDLLVRLRAREQNLAEVTRRWQEEVRRSQARIVELQEQVETLKEQIFLTNKQNTKQGAMHQRLLDAWGRAQQKLRERTGKSRAFLIWRSQSLVIERNESLHMSAMHHHRRMQLVTLSWWRTVARKQRMMKLQQQWQNQHNEEITQLTTQHATELASLRSQLDQQHQQLLHSRRDQSTLEQRMRQAFIRGVCALNREALAVFKSENDDGDAAANHLVSAALHAAGYTDGSNQQQYHHHHQQQKSSIEEKENVSAAEQASSASTSSAASSSSSDSDNLTDSNVTSTSTINTTTTNTTSSNARDILQSVTSLSRQLRSSSLLPGNDDDDDASGEQAYMQATGLSSSSSATAAAAAAAASSSHPPSPLSAINAAPPPPVRASLAGYGVVKAGSVLVPIVRQRLGRAGEDEDVAAAAGAGGGVSSSSSSSSIAGRSISPTKPMIRPKHKSSAGAIHSELERMQVQSTHRRGEQQIKQRSEKRKT